MDSQNATLDPLHVRRGIIQRIEALNYRSLRYVSQALRPFEILVGPNASGKSTFMDTIALAVCRRERSYGVRDRGTAVEVGCPARSHV